MDTSLSAKMRTRYLQDMSANKLDVLVIGGGITGRALLGTPAAEG